MFYFKVDFCLVVFQEAGEYYADWEMTTATLADIMNRAGHGIENICNPLSDGNGKGIFFHNHYARYILSSSFFLK